MDRLLEAVDVVEIIGDPCAVEVSSIALQNDRVTPGALFCCIPGRRFDGHSFAPDALERGASALLTERPLDLAAVQAVVAAGHARPAMARLAARLYGDPVAAMRSAGVTGTNGKTTVTHLLAQILESHGEPCLVVGTLQGSRTTPESPDLQHMLAEALARGTRAVSMEVSSHALTESRVEGIVFDAAVFTNLSQDHLDHHGTMEAYFAAKAALFTPGHARVGVVNADDPWGKRLLAEPHIPLTPFSLGEASEVELRIDGSRFRWRGREVMLALPGRYHIANALAAATAASVLGVDDETIVEGLRRAAPVPGRFEVLGLPEVPFTVVVDYGHTPDGLRAAIDSARVVARDGRVLCVFGCGGLRDREKRPRMGAVAVQLADLVVVTSDNPRTEDPEAIIEEILTGVDDRSAVVVEPDRRRAIERAMSEARAGDVVLVAGKGHEAVIEL
ncbi:MAG: UDP-N-acetylmuramoyl-L-alanyl-D-glutamate--2,6-diaminopimelate ligase, partial [Acidimicrobiales bacterium]